MPTTEPTPTSEISNEEGGSYFSEINQEVLCLNEVTDPNSYFDHLANIEDSVIDHVGRMIGDREFPAETREQILGLIAVHRLRDTFGNYQVGATHYVGMMRHSRLLRELRSVLHELATRNYQVRFGILTENPLVNIKACEDYDVILNKNKQ